MRARSNDWGGNSRGWLKKRSIDLQALFGFGWFKSMRKPEWEAKVCDSKDVYPWDNK